MSKRKERPDGVVIYRKSWEMLSMFSGNEVEAGKLMLAVADYFLTRKEPEFSELANKIAFEMFKSDILHGWEKFTEKCESARRRSNSKEVSFRDNGGYVDG